MITDIGSYLKFFDSVRRRTERDVAALPPEAAAWRPPAIAGESEWSIGQIIDHLGGSRLYFASAYRGEGWLWTRTETVMDADDPRTWLPWLRTSAERFTARLADTPAEWLTRRVEMIDTPGAALSGWRILMMMIEHEVHHRSQIDAYAGLQGWPVPDIFNRSAEHITTLQDEQRVRHAR
ncbi:MAG TPA: DinB family protein [Candidatus Acidoferrum sp.]|nr:DinB family protein [Candidatus Acidoferrum sp.]